MLNILYLTLAKKIDLPILYLSKFINQNRSTYYECLNEVQGDIKKLKSYLMFMIEGVYQMSEFTLKFIDSFMKIMNQASELVKEKCSKFYSQELMEHLFFDFYTKNDFLCKKLSITRNTASKYLHELTAAGLLIEEKIGKNKIYKNAFLYNLIRLW